MANPYAGKQNDVLPLPLATRILTLYKERKAATQSWHTALWHRIGRHYETYRPLYTGKASARKLDIPVPFALSICQSDVSRKTQISFGTWPVVDFVGYAEEDAPIAQKISTLVSAQMKDSDSFSKAYDFFLSADIYGTAIARVGWKHISRFEKHRFTSNDPMNPNRIVESIKGGWVTRFDGPDWEVVDILDFWPQPNKKRIKDMKWAMHRYLMEFEDIQALAAGGVYDKAAVRQLEMASMPKEVEDDYRFRINVYRNYGAWSASQEKFAKPIVCVDMIGEVPSQFAPDGVKYRLITVANDMVVLRNDPFPFWHGELPFIAYSPMPDMHYFHGIGKVEAVEKLQYLASRLASQKAEAMDQYINPMWLVNRLAGVDTQNLITRAGKVIGVDGPVSDDIIRPLSPDMRGIQLSYQEIQQLWTWSQQATGIIEDTIMGGQGGADRQTAHEFAGRQENVLSRQMLEAKLAEEGFVEPLGNFYRWHNKQFLTFPHQVQILGSGARVNPWTGLPLPQEPVILDVKDFHPDYRARAMGATQLLGKQAKQQNTMQMLQLASANPVAIQLINWTSMFRYVFKVFDMPNVDDFLVKAIPAINQVADQAGMSPQGLAGGLTSGGGLPPELMQAISGGGAVGG